MREFNKEAFDTFLKLMEERQARKSKLAEAKTEEHNKRIRSMPTNWQLTCRDYNRQVKCFHLKGTCAGYQIGAVEGDPKPIPMSMYSDYNVAMHTFITGETKIWCLSRCGWHVWNRPGWSYKWAVGLKMVNQSTNGPSSSEIMISPKSNPAGPPTGMPVSLGMGFEYEKKKT
jgi:hypothetical protein